MARRGDVDITYGAWQSGTVSKPTEAGFEIKVSAGQVIEEDTLFVTVTAGRSHEITSVTVGSQEYTPGNDSDKKREMTVEYTVSAANNGMAALLSSGSADIKVSATFTSRLDENDPDTWPLDDQNNLVAPSSLTTLPNNITS